MPVPLPDSVPVNWKKQLTRLVDKMPRQMVEGIPAMKTAVDRANLSLQGNPDNETCKALFDRINQARFER